MTELDGRRLRRQQNREAVLDAMVELFHEGQYTPSSGEIAERAGISARSVFRYFDDVDDLNRAAIDRQLAAARPMLDAAIDPGAPTGEKIERLVEARLQLFETIGPAGRAARVCAHRHPIVAAQIHESRSFMRHQIRRLFAPELDGEKAALLPAVDALLSFETHDLLRNEQGLSRTKTIAALTGALTALLDPPGGPS
jgi:AcrR family transcriptional regulator